MKSHDLFYSETKNFRTKPKFKWLYLSKIITKKIKKKKLIFFDIGTARGEAILFFRKKFPSLRLVGGEINNTLIKFAKKYTKEKIIYFDFNSKNLNKYKIKPDIIHASGVSGYFNDSTIKNLIKITNKGGYIYIYGNFNDYPIDYILKYRVLDNNVDFNSSNYQSGWSRSSKFTIRQLLKKNKKVKSFKFYDVPFPKNLNIKKKKNDPLRSWTINYKKKKYFMNGLGIISKEKILEIKIKN